MTARKCTQCGKETSCDACVGRVVARLQARRQDEANRQPAYCEYCGRTHAGRWECVERSERSAEEVRLWLMERGDL